MRPQPRTVKYRQLRDAESERNSPYRGKPRLLVILFQMINPENEHTRSIIQAEQVIFRNIYTYL